MDLKDRVCLVTGGTKGIGAATALAFAQAGAHVAVNGRYEDDSARAIQLELDTLDRKSALVIADCAQPDEATRCVEEAAQKLGGLDVLVHCAGGPAPGGLLELRPEVWYGAFDVHVHAVFHLCRAAVPLMRKKREGAILLVSSTAGKLALPTNIAYQVVKGALPQLTRALARELAPDNIRVNCVAPGVIRTRFHDSMTDEQRRINLEQRIPLRREGTPPQVASLVLELVRNDYITGETVTVDGGLTMRIA